MVMQTILKPTKGSEYETTFTGTSARVNIDEPRIGVYATEACFIKFGDETVTVSSSDYDMFIPAGVHFDVTTGGERYVAVIQSSSGGTAYINGWV